MIVENLSVQTVQLSMKKNCSVLTVAKNVLNARQSFHSLLSFGVMTVRSIGVKIVPPLFVLIAMRS